MLIQYVRTVAHLTLDVGSIDSDHFNETVELVHMTILWVEWLQQFELEHIWN